MDKRYESLVDTVMQNKDQVRKINDEIYTTRLIELFKEKFKIEDKEISYEEFLKLASATQGHQYDHNYNQDQDHDHGHGHEHEHEQENTHENNH